MRRALRGRGAPFHQRPRRAQMYLSSEELPTATLGGVWSQTAGEAALCPRACRCCPCHRCPRSVTGRASGKETDGEFARRPRALTALLADSVHTARARGAGPRMKREPRALGRHVRRGLPGAYCRGDRRMGRRRVLPGVRGT